jgi:hypothetical protein
MHVDLARVAEVLAHVIAASIAYKRTRPGRENFAPSLRPLWLFLALTLGADGVRWLGQRFVLQSSPRPFTGFARAVFHVDQLGVIGWNAGLLALVVLAFFGRERVASKLTPIASCAFGVVLAFAFAYPELRAERLGHAYLCVEVVTVLACVAIALHSWLKSRWFGIAARAATVLVVGEIATLLGPFLGEPFRYWSTANAISAVTYTILAWELRRAATLLAT